MINKVTVRRFKRLSEVTCDLKRVTALVGANNSGKTSFLQALHFAATAAQSARLLTTSDWAGDHFEATLGFGDLLYVPSENGQGVFAADGGDIEVELHGDAATCRVSVATDGTGAIRVALDGRAIGEQLQRLPSPFSMYAPGLAGVARREEGISPGVLFRAVARGDANRVLRNVLLSLTKDRAAWALFTESISKVFGSLSFRVRHDELDQYISAEFRLGDGPWLPIDAAGNGILQAAQLLGYIHLFSPQLLILDEPDSHLHPDNQRRMCRLLVELASNRDLQVVFATHSRHVLDAAKGDVELVWLTQGKAVPSSEAQFTPMLLDLGALDAIDYVRSAHPRCVVATEDTDTKLLESLLACNGFVMNEAFVLSFSGCSQLQAALVLAEYLRLRAPGVRLVIHLDRDYMSDDEVKRIGGKLAEAGVKLFVTECNDIEHQFINPEHIAAVTGVAPAVATTIVADVIAQSKDASIKEIINQRTLRAFRKRNAGGASVNHGEIGLAALTDYDTAPTKMCHGKTVLAQLRQTLNQETGHHPQFHQASAHLNIAGLRAIAADIWGT